MNVTKSAPEWNANYFKLQNMKYIIQFGSRPRLHYSNYLNNFFIMVSTGSIGPSGSP